MAQVSNQAQFEAFFGPRPQWNRQTDGHWRSDSGGSTGSRDTGPSPNNPDPFVHTEASGGPALSVIEANGIAQFLTIPSGAGRLLTLRVCIQGDFGDGAEGLEIQYRTGPSATWQRAGFIHGWPYVASRTLGQTFTDEGGNTRTVVRDGGWIDVDTVIPDAATEVRLHPQYTLGSNEKFTHDVALQDIAWGKVDLKPSFGSAVVPEQVYVRGVAIPGLTLPEATGGNSPLTYSLSPGLPSGLAFNSSNRRITGIPTAARGRTRYVLTARDADGDITPLIFFITVREPSAVDRKPTFGSSVVPEQTYVDGTGIVDLQLPEATGGEGNLAYSLAPALPDGLVFNSATRRITGTPIVSQAKTAYVLTARDIVGDATTITFFLTVQAAPPAGTPLKEGPLTIGTDPTTIAGTPATADDPDSEDVVLIDDLGDTLTFEDDEESEWQLGSEVITRVAVERMDIAILVEVEVNNLTVLRMQQSKFRSLSYDNQKWEGRKIVQIADVGEGESQSAARLSLTFYDEEIGWSTDPGPLPVRVIWLAKDSTSPDWEEVSTLVGRVGGLTIENGYYYTFEVTPESSLSGPVNDEVLSHDSQYTRHPGDIGLIHVEDAVNNYFEVYRAPREYGGLGVQGVDDILKPPKRTNPPATVRGADATGVLVLSRVTDGVINMVNSPLIARLSDDNDPTNESWRWWLRDGPDDTTAEEITGSNVVTATLRSSLILTSEFIGKQVMVEVQYEDDYNEDPDFATLESPWITVL